MILHYFDFFSTNVIIYVQSSLVQFSSVQKEAKNSNNFWPLHKIL